MGKSIKTDSQEDNNMRKQKVTKTLKQVAARNGTNIEEVRMEIDHAIQTGMSNPDPAVQAKWRELFPDGRIPTAEEVLSLLADEAKQKT